MSLTLAQIFAANPTTIVQDTDLFYLVQSPYTPGTDAGITGASLKAAFGSGGTINPGLANQIAYYATSGSTISGLAGGNDGVLITSPLGVPSISSTLPNAVQDNITRLGTQAENLNMGGFRITNMADGIAATDAATVGQVAAAASPLTTKGDLYTFTTVNARLPVAVGNGKVLQVNSATATGLDYSTPTYPSLSGTAGTILRSDGTNNVYSTSTFADTYASSSLLFSSGANTVVGLATANNGLLVTSNTGVPSILAGPGVTGRILQSNAAAAPSFSTATYPSVAGTSGNMLISDGTNYIASTSLWPNTVGTAGKIIRSNGTINTYTTATFADTYTASNLLYSNGANTVIGLPTANNGILSTDASGVPSIGTTVPAAVLLNIPGRLINVQTFTSGSSTYTPTTGTNTAIAYVQGGGGGGAGGGTTPTNGGAGGNSTLSNGGGTIAQGVGGAPGRASSTTPVLAGTANSGTINLTGSAGQIGATNTFGGMGGPGIFGTGAGVGGLTAQPPSAGGTNTGAGGGGGGGTSSAGGGGQAGGLSIRYLTGVTGTYTAAVGAGGTAGTSAGNPGATGGSGIIIIFEYT